MAGSGRAVRVVLMVVVLLGASTPASGPAVTAHGSLPGAPDEARAIEFHTADGVRIRGHRFGSGAPVVILSHMYGTDQRIWFDLARRLAARGYTAITYDYRGIGRSSGRFVIARTYRDAVGAVDYARRGGSRPVILVGASMGGTVSLIAAGHRRVNGVVVIASGMQFRGLDARPYLPSLGVPKLFIAGAGDRPFATSVRAMYAMTPPPKRLRLYPTWRHGTDLFDSPYAGEVERQVVRFIRRRAR